ncbi:hypothetical protein LI328DRAFT_162652 [Trichoderma asperelloides]|nr:hypothetical protein LI328DRAFT_162652 [Trichoderma asperelloides]
MHPSFERCSSALAYGFYARPGIPRLPDSFPPATCVAGSTDRLGPCTSYSASRSALFFVALIRQLAGRSMRQCLPRYRGTAAVPGITSNYSLPSQAKPSQQRCYYQSCFIKGIPPDGASTNYHASRVPEFSYS